MFVTVAGSACVQANNLLETSRRGEILYYEDAPVFKKTKAIRKSTIIGESDLFCKSLDEFETPLTMSDWTARLNIKHVMQYIPVGLRSKIQGGGLEGGEVHQR